MASEHVSAIGMALNRKSATVNIPKPRDNVAVRDNFTAVPATGDRGGLPTPPQSLSPNLPATAHFDSTGSDTELKDAIAQPQLNALNAEALDSLGDLDSVGAITPNLLAKHHLPDILLAHGPLAIRHIMGYLTTSVPGFSRITSAKARRLVVAALEGRGAGDGAGVNGDVLFDKVGWGRWDARLRGQPPRDHGSSITPPGSLPNSYSHGLQVPGQRSQHSGSEAFGTSFTGNSGIFSYSEAENDDRDAFEHEADKMSLDNDRSGYASSEPGDDMDIDLGAGEETDEEDWASIGAEALRARSFPKGAIRRPSGGGRLYQPIASYSTTTRRRSRTPAHLARSAPTRPIHVHNIPLDAGVNSSSEKAAIEALLSLGSRP